MHSITFSYIQLTLPKNLETSKFCKIATLGQLPIPGTSVAAATLATAISPKSLLKKERSAVITKKLNDGLHLEHFRFFLVKLKSFFASKLEIFLIANFTRDTNRLMSKMRLKSGREFPRRFSRLNVLSSRRSLEFDNFTRLSGSAAAFGSVYSKSEKFSRMGFGDCVVVCRGSFVEIVFTRLFTEADEDNESRLLRVLEINFCHQSSVKNNLREILQLQR